MYVYSYLCVMHTFKCILYIDEYVFLYVYVYACTSDRGDEKTAARVCAHTRHARHMCIHIHVHHSCVFRHTRTRTYVYMHMYEYIILFVCMYTYISQRGDGRTAVHFCAHAHRQAWHMCIHTHIHHPYVFRHKRTHTYVYTYMYKHVYLLVYVYTYISDRGDGRTAARLFTHVTRHERAAVGSEASAQSHSRGSHC